MALLLDLVLRRFRTLLCISGIRPRTWLEALLKLTPIVIEPTDVQPGRVPQHVFDDLLDWLVVDVQLSKKGHVLADQVDVDLVSLTFV